MLSNSDIEKLQKATQGIETKQNELSPEELSAFVALVELFNSGDFESGESGGNIKTIKDGLAKHANSRLLSLHLKNFIALCEQYFKKSAPAPQLQPQQFVVAPAPAQKNTVAPPVTPAIFNGMAQADIDKWQKAIAGIGEKQSELSPEELSAFTALMELFSSGNFESEEGISCLNTLKNGLVRHAGNRLLHIHLKNFVDICSKYDKGNTNNNAQTTVTNPSAGKKKGSSRSLIIIAIVLIGTWFVFKNWNSDVKPLLQDLGILNKVISVIAITLDKDTLQLTTGEVRQITATLIPDKATNRHITWSSNDSTVATVNAEGKITAIAPGTANITATCDTIKSKVCLVSVRTFGMSATGLPATDNSIINTAKTPLELNKSYDKQISDAGFSDFRIITPEDGSLTLTLETNAENTAVALYNENGIFLKPVAQDIIAGTCDDYSGGGGVLTMAGAGKVYGQNLSLQWNPTVQKFKGSFTFKLDAGNYYLRMVRSTTGLSIANISVRFAALNENKTVTQHLPAASYNGAISSITSQRLLTTDDLRGLSKSELRILRNEIYARHGFRFKSADLQAYFSKQSWYQPLYNDVSLTNIEQKNVEFIQRHE